MAFTFNLDIVEMRRRHALHATIIGPLALGCVALLLMASGRSPAAAADRASLEFRAAAVLSKHCLECHDSAAESGDLDLSRRSTALEGGEQGPGIVPGDLEGSLVWEMVDSEAMPPESHPRMTDAEKDILREWIETGVPWAAKVIDPAEFTLDAAPPPMWLRRLTVPQYVRTVRALTGVEIGEEAAQVLPKDQRADGFTNTAYNLDIDLAHVEGFARLAELIVDQMSMTSFLGRHAPCRTLDDECIDAAIESMAMEFYRGRPEKHELAVLRKVFDTAVEEGGDFDAGARFVVQALLQSPRFLFLIEEAASGSEPEQVSDWELASRLSYAAWGQSPDQELLRAASAGELSDPRRLKAQVQRLMRDERAIEHSVEFVENWLDLGRLRNLRPNPKKFPDWDAELAQDMKTETETFFREIAWRQNRPLSDLMNAQVSYLTPRLAQHYDIPWDFAAELSDQHAAAASGELLALYSFDQNSEGTVADLVGGEPLDLEVTEPDRVSWTSDGLKLDSEVIVSSGPAPKLNRAIKEAGEFTIETWALPKNRGQRGPARVVSISGGSTQRNVTIGQEGDRYVVRYRSTERDNNGMPNIEAAHGSVENRWTHLAFTVDREGIATFYVNGEQAAQENAGGDLSNWEDSFPLLIGNETGGDRAWLGTLRRVGIYPRALSAEEIRQMNVGAVSHDLDSTPARGGLLTQASLLTIGGDEASMVSRGLFVLNNLLYSRVGNPPPCVDTDPKPSKPGMSQRDLAMVRLSDSACAGCHSKFEPLAFGLEKFDGVGAFHDIDEHGNELRHDGEILFPGQEEPVAYETSAELMELLASSERVHKGMTRKLIQFAIARPLVPADTEAVQEIHTRGWDNGGTYASLMAEIMTSDLILKKYPETDN